MSSFFNYVISLNYVSNLSYVILNYVINFQCQIREVSRAPLGAAIPTSLLFGPVAV